MIRFFVILLLCALPCSAQMLQAIVGQQAAASPTQVATPTVDNGTNTYANDVTVTASDSTGSAIICYSIDGSDPTASTPGTCDGSTYSTPLSVTATAANLKFIGTKAGLTNSAVASFTYTLTVATPTHSPDTSTIASGAPITIATSTTSPTLKYCTDAVNTCDASAGTTYTVPVTSITTTGTYLRSIGSKASYNSSTVKSSQYTISAGATAPTAVGTMVKAGHTASTANLTPSVTIANSGNTLIVNTARSVVGAVISVTGGGCTWVNSIASYSDGGSGNIYRQDLGYNCTLTGAQTITISPNGTSTVLNAFVDQVTGAATASSPVDVVSAAKAATSTTWSTNATAGLAQQNEMIYVTVWSDNAAASAAAGYSILHHSTGSSTSPVGEIQTMDVDSGSSLSGVSSTGAVPSGNWVAFTTTLKRP